MSERLGCVDVGVVTKSTLDTPFISYLIALMIANFLAELINMIISFFSG